MIRVARVDESGKTKYGGDELLDGAGTLWVDVEKPTEAEMLALKQRFGLHQLAVEDCLKLDQRPKLEEYPAHLFVVLHGFTAAEDDSCDLTLHEMHFLLGPTWLITVHNHASSAVDDAKRWIDASSSDGVGKGPDAIAYRIADALVDLNFPILDRMRDDLEALETELFDRPVPQQLNRIFDLRRAMVALRRVLSPQRDVVRLLAQRGLPHIQERTTLYFRDIYDHLVRLYEQIDAGRDMIGNASDAYLSMVANRTGEISKQLTIFATLFLPLSFITGFFGQNFSVLSREEFLWIMVALVCLVPIGLFIWFRRRQWL